MHGADFCVSPPHVSARPVVGQPAKGKHAFVIMPFSATPAHSKQEWTDIYDNLHRPAIEECGYTCERAKPRTGNLISSIIENLRLSWVVLADLTDNNPNVFYELGVRHALSKRTIVVCQDSSAIPSDLRGTWTLVYATDLAGAALFKREIRRILREIEEQPERADSPVAEYIERENLSASRYVYLENVKKLGALTTELSGNALVLDTLTLGRRVPGSSAMVTDCLRLLLTTLYVDIGPELLKSAYELSAYLRRIELGDRSYDTISPAAEALVALAEGIVAIREKLVRAEYEEPRTVSTVMWVPVQGQRDPRVPESHCSAVAAQHIRGVLRRLRGTLPSVHTGPAGSPDTGDS